MLSRVKSGQSFTRFASTRRKPALLVLCLLLVTITSPVISQSVDMTDDVALDKHLSLQIEAPKDDLSWGDEALVRLTAANTGTADIEAVALNLQDQPGVAWGDDFKGQWLELGNLAAGESQVIEGHARVDGSPSSGALSLYATLHGNDVEPAEATAALSVPGREPEEIAISKQGNLIDVAAGRVHFSFPDGWNESDAQLTFHLQEQFRQESGDSGRLLLFTIEATADDALVEAFDAPVAVEIDLSDLVDPEWSAGNRPVVSTRQSEKEDWTAVESKFDPEMGVLSFSTSHFSLYQVTTDPQLWKLQYNPPGASPYTGAATYQYPIDLPPGIGGLTPGLALGYSSRPIDSMSAPVMSQGFGAGWSLPQAQITNGNSGPMYNTNGCCNFDKNAFTLVLNGVTYNLSPAQGVSRYGRYYAVGQPDILVEYLVDDNGANNTDNVSGEFWRVRTGNGTTYTFGRTMESEQVVYPVSNFHNLGQFRNKLYSPYNWKIDLIQDVHGNKIEYVYENNRCGLDFYGAERRGQLGPEHNYAYQCTEVDTAVSEIRYNFTGSTPSTTVAFTYDEMNGGGLRTVDLMNVGFYRPSRIDVRQGSTTVLYSYLFTYHPLGFHYYGPWEISTQFWMLASISKIGVGGSGALPAQTFTYEMTPFGGCASGDNQGETNYCVQALKRVDNGYGAVTEFSFTKIDNKWMHVTTADTWDGVAAKYGSGARPQSRLAYDRAGQAACFDNAGSACHLGLTPPSGALVGFDGVTILTQAPSGASAWTSLGKQVVTFENGNYWLLGRTSSDERHIPGGVRVSRSVYEWVDAGEAYIQLDFETHATYDPLDVSRFTTKTIDYEYYPFNPGNGQYGALKERREIDEADNPYRCTQYEYAQNTAGGNWLINYPLRETLYSGTCTGTRVSETLYRYAGSANPQQQALDNRGLLTYVLRLRDTASNGYSTEKLTYTAQGLQESIITFGTDSTTTAYTTDTRNTTTTTYNTLGMPTRVETTAAGVTKQTDTIDYDATFAWLVAKITDSNGIFTQYDYDNFGRLSMVAMPGDSLTTNGATIRYDYYDDGATKFVSPLLVGVFYKGGIKSDERQFYDGLGRLVQTQTAEVAVEGSGDKDIVATTSYDARGLAVCATVPYAVAPYVYNPSNPVTPFQTTACTAKSRTTTSYDALGRATQVTTPDGAATGTVYGVSTNITVDGHNKFQSTQVTDGNNHRTVNYTDVFGRPALVRENTGSGTYTAYADTRYTYDVTGNLTEVKKSQASNDQSAGILWQTTMSYDALGRKTAMSDPDMREFAYVYDGAGNLTRQEHRSNSTTVHQATCFYYDNLNRLLNRVNDASPADACPTSAPPPGANHLAGYVYGTSKANRNIGKPVEVNWGATPTENRDTFTYDAEGRLGAQTRKVNNQTFVYEVTVYDVLDRPTSVKLPSGEVVATTYDEEGVNTLAAGAMSLISKVGYNERGQRTLLERPGAGPETTLSYYGAADNFRLSGIANSGDGNLPDFSYGNYDVIGNLTQFTAGADSYTYTYDEQDRLKTVTGAIGRDYTYDRLGNFDSVTRGSTLWDYTYASGNASRLMSVTNLPLTVDAAAGYDTWGNLRKYALQGVAYELTFDAENRLASLKKGTATTTFAYDADGQRVMTTYPDGTIVYTPFPDYEVEDPPTGSNIVRTTYRLTGQIVAVQTKVGTAGGTFYYTYTDHLGNITALSTTGGAYVTGSNARYDPFGTFTTTTPTSNPSISNHGFTGHRHNNTGTNDLDLIYMNARYYMPLVGRFISPDTIVPDPGNPQSFNRYSYIENRPLNGTDPSGHCIVAYSGDVRMNDGPYGTSGLCPNTSSWIIEGNAAISAYYQQPVPEYWLFNKMKSRLSSFYDADANGVGILAQASIDSPIAGIELMSGQEIIHSNADNSTTRFIVIGGGVRVGPSASFVGSLKGLVKSGNPINATISPYVSGIDNVDNLVEDYSGPFTYRSTAISAEVGVTWGETKSPPNPLGNRASSEFIGPALGYALTTSYGSGVSIPLYTQSPGQLLPTIHWQKAWEVITGLWD